MKCRGYVDDMVAKSQSIAQHMADLEEVYGELCRGLGEGKFLGFMITHQGIKANPNKCTAILEMHNPTNVQLV